MDLYIVEISIRICFGEGFTKTHECALPRTENTKECVFLDKDCDVQKIMTFL